MSASLNITMLNVPHLAGENAGVVYNITTLIFHENYKQLYLHGTRMNATTSDEVASQPRAMLPIRSILNYLLLEMD